MLGSCKPVCFKFLEVSRSSFDTNTHLFSAIRDFEGLVTPDEYARLRGLPYLRNQNEVDNFGEFVRSLNVKKITGKLH